MRGKGSKARVLCRTSCCAKSVGGVLPFNSYSEGGGLRFSSLANVERTNDKERTGWLARQPYGFWRDIDHRRELIESIGVDLGVNQVSLIIIIPGYC